jgi:hypothetical protein
VWERISASSWAKRKWASQKPYPFNSSYGSNSSGPSELDNTKEMLPKKIHFQEEKKIKNKSLWSKLKFLAHW